jgi:predicted molibdopterin-dependent oxidoreductase YjgC
MGTFMNAERSIQRVRRAIEPVGESATGPVESASWPRPWGTPTSEIIKRTLSVLVLARNKPRTASVQRTMTERTPNHDLRPADLLDISPSNAASLGLASGDFARVTSRYGEATLPVHTSESIKPRP